MPQYPKAGGKPIEHRVTATGQIHPHRDDPPDQDEDSWRSALSGAPEDPWKDTRYLYLINLSTGAGHIFVTDSYGGRKDIGILKSTITNMRMARPGGVPIVTAVTAPFKTQFGMRKRPEFEMIGWRSTNGDQPDDPQPKLVERKPGYGDKVPF
jgi:hypothetical protein